MIKESYYYSIDSCRSERDKYWTEFIQKCRISGLSDYEWCQRNSISTRGGYYAAKFLTDCHGYVHTDGFSGYNRLKDVNS